jgi:hypothetical protein
MRTNLAILALVSLVGVCHASTIVTNGGFETGDFTGWVLSGNTADTFVSTDQPHSGNFAADLGASPTDGSLTQLLPTVAGETYTLTYWLQNEGGTPNDFSASWNGSTLSSSVLTEAIGFPYTEYSFANLEASSNTTPLKFVFEQTPAFWHLDDVSVKGTPEPASLGLCIGGLVVLILTGCHQRKCSSRTRSESAWSVCVQRIARPS